MLTRQILPCRGRHGAKSQQVIPLHHVITSGDVVPLAVIGIASARGAVPMAIPATRFMAPMALMEALDIGAHIPIPVGATFADGIFTWVIVESGPLSMLKNLFGPGNGSPIKFATNDCSSWRLMTWRMRAYF